MRSRIEILRRESQKVGSTDLRAEELTNSERERLAAFDLRVGELEHREQAATDRDTAFEAGLLPGRRWLAEAFAAIRAERDKSKEEYLRNGASTGSEGGRSVANYLRKGGF